MYGNYSIKVSLLPPAFGNFRHDDSAPQALRSPLRPCGPCGLENYVLLLLYEYAIIRAMDEQFFEDVMEYLQSIGRINSDDIPNLELYMDQVTGFMENRLQALKRHEDDKVLTKTMINNYAKNRLLPPPDKKRYRREHILILLFIYYYKSILQLNDIEAILRPLKDKYFDGQGSATLKDIYDEIFDHEPAVKEQALREVQDMKKKAAEAFRTEDPRFQNLSEEDQKELQLFLFLCEIGTDIYLKKLLMEKIADELHQHPQP